MVRAIRNEAIYGGPQGRGIAQAAHAQDQDPRCPVCAAFPRLTLQFLNFGNGSTIRLHECLCGHRIWDDGPALFA